MGIIFANNALSKLAQPLTVGQTTLTVQSGTGALFPSPSGGDYFKLTVADRRTQQIEIMHCTGRSGDVLTVVRAQENMAQQNFLVDATVSNRFTRDTPEAILAEVPNPNPLFLGAFATPPVADNDGNPLTVGMNYFNTGNSHVYYWTGASWVDPVGTTNLTSSSGTFVLQDPSGGFDGVTTDFNLRYTDYSAATKTPDVVIAEQFFVWLDGVAQKPGVDFTIPALGIIRFAVAPASDVLFHGVWVALTGYNIMVASPGIGAGVLPLDFNNGDGASISLNANVTSITVANWKPAGQLSKMTIFFKQLAPGGFTVAFPSFWKWPAGAGAPVVTPTALKIDILVVMSMDAGTTVFATLAGQNY